MHHISGLVELQEWAVASISLEDVFLSIAEEAEPTDQEAEEVIDVNSTATTSTKQKKPKRDALLAKEEEIELVEVDERSDSD